MNKKEMSFQDLEIKNAKDVFAHALEIGFFSRDKEADNNVSRYMYMCSKDGKDYFKHSLTRQYVVNEKGYEADLCD